MTIRNTQPKPAAPARSDAGILTTGLEFQQQGLDLLLAEMRALAAMMPGEALQLSTDAEVEAAFDNMPI